MNDWLELPKPAFHQSWLVAILDDQVLQKAKEKEKIPNQRLEESKRKTKIPNQRLEESKSKICRKVVGPDNV